MSPLLRKVEKLKTNTLIKKFEQDLMDQINESKLPISLIRIILELMLNKVIQAELETITKEQIEMQVEEQESIPEQKVEEQESIPEQKIESVPEPIKEKEGE